MSDPELWRACAVVAQKDVQPLRRAMFDQLSSRTFALRAALAAWDCIGTGRRAAAFVSPFVLEAFLRVRAPSDRADLLAVWKYENERRQIAALAALDPTLHIASITLGPSASIDPPSAALIAEGYEIVRAHASRGDFLVAARVASTVGHYLRMLPLLEESRARAVLVSSDSNPYAVALVHAARRLGKKTCFVTHGHVAEGPLPLRFDLSLLDGPVVREVYERAGPIEGEVIYKGSEGVARPMKTERIERGIRTLGVVLSILVDWRKIGGILRRLSRELSPERVLLRLHPNETMLDPSWSEHVDLEAIEVSRGERSLIDDASRCDLIAAGNTSAHLTVLKLGVPSVYLSELDEMGDDYYRFAREKIVTTSLDRQAIAAFYDDPGWIARFARFDAGYPDRQRDCDRAVVSALHRLIGARS